MKVTQHRYLSPEACALRRRDGVPPWGVHPCEVNSLAKLKDNTTVFGAHLLAAAEMRRRLEAEGR